MKSRTTLRSRVGPIHGSGIKTKGPVGKGWGGQLKSWGGNGVGGVFKYTSEETF